MQLNQATDRDPQRMFMPPTKICCEHDEEMEVVTATCV